MTDRTENNSSATPAPSWRRQLSVLIALAMASTLVFWVTDLDMRVAGWFHNPANPVLPWPHEYDPLWRFFYHGAPLFTAVYALGGLLIILLSMGIRRLRRWRRPAAMLLLTLVIGPGLLVNVLLKENTGRPRPRQVEQFGGDQAFLPPLRMNWGADGKSFPAGHASVGFSLFVLWFLWRRDRPRMAWAGLAAAAALGLMMGMGRIASGAHFLSDVLWAAYITFFAALVTHFFLLRPKRAGSSSEDAQSVTPLLTQIGYAVLGMGLLIGSLLGFPVNERIEYAHAAGNTTIPEKLRLELGHADIYLSLTDSEDKLFKVSGEVRGFGLPTSKFENFAIPLWEADTEVLRYRYRELGLFAELNANLHIELNPDGFDAIHLHLREGNIHLLQTGVAAPPHLHLETQAGEVITQHPARSQTPELL